MTLQALANQTQSRLLALQVASTQALMDGDEPTYVDCFDSYVQLNEILVLATRLIEEAEEAENMELSDLSAKTRYLQYLVTVHF